MKTLIIGLSLLTLTACAGNMEKAMCRHKAMLTAITYGEKYPVRIVAGKIKGQINYHAQAQAKIKGEWRWLEFGEYPTIGSREYELEDPFFYTVNMFFEQIIRPKQVWVDKSDK